MANGLNSRVPPNNLNSATGREYDQRFRSDQLRTTPRPPTAGTTRCSKYSCQIGLFEYTTSAYRPREHHAVHTRSCSTMAAASHSRKARITKGRRTSKSGHAHHGPRLLIANITKIPSPLRFHRGVMSSVTRWSSLAL